MADKLIKVQAMRGDDLTYPELYMDVYVVGDGSHDSVGFPKMFMRSHCSKAKTLDEASLVIFTGGEDITPSIYSQQPMACTKYWSPRDREEIKIFYECWSKGIPMLGVCRGAQLLWAMMEGGELYQDVDGHNGAHSIFDIGNKRTLTHISSVHHQMCAPRSDDAAMILATASRTSERHKFGSTYTKPIGQKFHDDIEAYYINGCLGVQGHPEYQGYNGYTQWCLNLTEDMFITNTDFEWSDSNVRRMTPEALARRGRCRSIDVDDLSNIIIEATITPDSSM